MGNSEPLVSTIAAAWRMGGRAVIHMDVDAAVACKQSSVDIVRERLVRVPSVERSRRAERVPQENIQYCVAPFCHTG